MNNSLKCVCSISSEGWITDSKKILDCLMNYYILTDSAQSYIFQGKLISLPKTYYENINNPDGMANGVRLDLEKLLSCYFEVVEVNTKSKVIEGNGYGILISASCIDKENRRIELFKITEIDTSKFRKVSNFNNYGSADAYLDSI